MIRKITNFISYKLIPIITLDKYAPNVAPWNSSFLNWHYLKNSMTNTSENDIKGICVDIGSGNSPYKKYFKNIISYISVDKEDSSASTHQKNCNTINADARNLPFENDFADTIILNQVLEHIYEHKKVLSEISRILKKKGKLIISVPFIYHIHAEPNDYFRFTEYGIKQLLKDNGFKIIEFHYNGYFGTTIFSIINNFIWQVWNKNIYLKFLRNTILLPFILIIFFINNILGLIFDLFKTKKFCPNYFIICEKENE